MRFLVKIASGRSPRIPPSADLELEIEMFTERETGTIQPLSEQQQLRAECMMRDNYRCIVTGIWDKKHFLKVPSDERKGHRHSRILCAHILPFALSEFNESSAIIVCPTTHCQF